MSGARYADSIDLWQVRIEARGRHETDAALGMLSAAERERAAHFVAAGARAKFLVGRAALRVVLAAYLNGDPLNSGSPKIREENRGCGSRAVLVYISTSATRMHWS